ncbi:battenin [Bombus vosnesenskii]|uniref:Battenin n=2 Tax=Pyrobombus TaxID=144703 RepID=A0A6J3KSI2_9HYME|nr:battenin [Bombus vancouverensis nearcticus]XP_033188049.1 battenin [Bombus vancouverensis nearcticus]XP_033188050.1 battenin [Bombus vancouverensis nearcticus]XP_033302344.1 battenin [Bombus bifarius]XP_033302346.1 battenin [Bombus bifarius]XP_033302347.1 battenin [Bombus bifarius]XP_033356317.1 battenin [Bombus vosnesenskii]XP_033356318.1 battenin [Bombus vosnesenskii]XP_033356319.1 battenin [Bombus vosnesenskii]XP_050480742.1 battenin [Bombus huntii]XP_050480743.1 battenin [Bombus hu
MAKGKPLTVSERRANDVFDEESIAVRSRWRNFAAFWILGLCNNYGYVVMLSAAHDILESKFGTTMEPVTEFTNGTVTTTNTTGIRSCNTLSTGAILLADILPSLAVKTITPFLPFYVHARLATCVLFSAAGFLMVSLSTTEWLAILGVVVTSLSSGLGEVTLLSYSHQYPKQVIATWSSGTGGAGIIGALSYASLTMWLSNEDTLLVMLIVPIIQGITFWLVLVHPPQSSIPITKNGIDSQEHIIEIPRKSFKEKINLVPGLMKYMIPLGLVYLFEYFINQGLYELIEFDDIWLTHAEQYRWLQVDYQIGVFISRSSVNLITINKIWIMALLQFINVIILLFETLFYYLPSIWIVFAFVLWEGLLGGGAYVNTFYRMSTEIPRADRKISLGIATMADSIGIALAGWLSMPVHNAICRLPQPSRVGS